MNRFLAATLLCGAALVIGCDNGDAEPGINTETPPEIEQQMEAYGQETTAIE